MIECKDCKLESTACICPTVDEFFKENRELMEDLAELEAKEKPGAVRCLACYFYGCRCLSGYFRRNKA